MLDFTFLFNIQTERSTVQLANFEQALNLIDIRIIETKDWFDWDHNLSHLTLYPDVLKIKTIIVALRNKNLQKCQLYIIYKFINP